MRDATLTQAETLLDASRARILAASTEPGNPPVGAPYPFVCHWCQAPMHRAKRVGLGGVINLVTINTCGPDCTEPSFH